MSLKRIKMIGLATGLVLMVIWLSWGLFIMYTTPRPNYNVVGHEDSGVEIRDYEEQTWISTDNTGDRNAFMTLASYIFGENEEGKKIAMTAPVVTDHRMSFILFKDDQKN